ncbi:hypothetical protein [Parabacteroides goldsteinii]|uniref:hypothetical protein n=1 Tax=Parabacteroides goldsteinii TaxID=328812 RepID=UPI003AB17493
MNLKHRHIIIGIGLLLCGLLGFVSCTDESLELPREEEDGNHIFLTFQATLAGVSTRAGEEPVADDRVKTLRIVIVSQGKEEGTENAAADAAWVVEHNQTVSWRSQLSNRYTFEVAPNSRKRIYLIANESNDNGKNLVGANGTPLNFSDERFIPDATTDRAPVDDYVFDVSTLDYSYTPSALPMTALYEIDVPPLNMFPDGKLTYPDPLYLVRAATKFSFKFTNQSKKRDITVTGIDINGVITDQMYLMPHVNKKDDKYWVVEETETNGNVTYTPLDLEKDWIDWMGYEANASQSGADNKWLTDYKVPTSVTSTATVDASLKIPAATDAQPSPSAETSNAIYLPESKTIKGGSNPLELQEYSITVRTKERAVGGTEEEVKTYPPKTLPHLASLFRNTHVVVGFIFTEDADELVVDVIPFTSVELKPDYGLEREEFTGYIVGKDENGNKCWYDQTENPTDPTKRTPFYLGKDNNASFVTINSKEYLLVYTDFDRTAAKLNHFFEKETRKKYLLTPEGITGYKYGNDMYLNKMQQRVWLDSGGDPNGDADAQSIYAALQKVGLNLKCCRILYEWDRLDWNKARWWETKNIYPKYWFDILGNRYPWSEGDTAEKRKNKLGEWVQYLE